MTGKQTLVLAIAVVVFAGMAYFALGFVIMSAPGTTTVTVGPRTVEQPSN
jgi:hypothetical protein